MPPLILETCRWMSVAKARASSVGGHRATARMTRTPRARSVAPRPGFRATTAPARMRGSGIGQSGAATQPRIAGAMVWGRVWRRAGGVRRRRRKRRPRTGGRQGPRRRRKPIRYGTAAECVLGRVMRTGGRGRRFGRCRWGSAGLARRRRRARKRDPRVQRERQARRVVLERKMAQKQTKWLRGGAGRGGGGCGTACDWQRQLLGHGASLWRKNKKH